ncbi:trypsin-like peptidase domain-containing protein [Streptomyces somaliensis DSM 40738]|uniref:Trypsin-like serine protease n=1 Tax=Streptomyces somaliensis (strain ATCC 33201 / DSM 40738 / JCM 12659 / KCTC 9044 / NCTC 11332 / NRRL B-12077 / IP 733) TaxID=1134445 RepID=A0AA44IC43_STRE0|nr:trypsin-like peptidase domain-containing protein [Streptomyces somaliensis]MCQ0023368.1 trypsin-like peptidase domain-containing protein [Streptomyces somaliensis DSM 40738]NKY12803.1 trypsin-like serine protease [Streptomyces somaliensis DSM 40738]
MTDHDGRTAGHQGNDEPQRYAGFREPVPPPPAHAPAGRAGTRRHRRHRAGRPTGLITAVAVAAAVAGGGAGALAQNLAVDGTTAAPAGAAGADAPRSGAGTLAGVAQAVSPSIVEIRSASASGGSTGSGVVVTEDGEVVTNHHVIAGASGIEVLLGDGSVRTAEVVGTDPAKDLALLRLHGAGGLKAAVLGDSDTVRVGDQVVAIGSPEGLTNTVTSGIVSALDRDVTVTGGGDSGRAGRGDRPSGHGGGTGSPPAAYKAIQTDAALNPGNSGGALVNLKGEVIGINSAMYAPDATADPAGAGSVGLGFAIPVDTLKSGLDALRGD